MNNNLTIIFVQYVLWLAYNVVAGVVEDNSHFEKRTNPFSEKHFKREYVVSFNTCD